MFKMEILYEYKKIAVIEREKREKIKRKDKRLFQEKERIDRRKRKDRQKNKAK